MGEVEFYNGLIQGKDRAISGTVTKIRDGCKIKNEIIEEKQSAYLIEKSNIYTEYIVQIDDVKYYTLQEAINSIEEQEEKKIQVLKDFELESEVNFNKNVILDLNGHTITNYYYKISNNKKLILEDSTTSKQGKLECTGTSIGIINKDSGSVEIKGVSINESNYGIYNYDTSTLKILEGTISGIECGVYTNSTGKIIVNGGTIEGEQYGIVNNNTGEIEITNGTVQNTKDNGSGYSAIENKKKAQITITGGTIESFSYGIDNSGGTIILSEGNIIGADCGIYNSGGTIRVDGGTITCKGDHGVKDRYGIRNGGSNSTVMMTNGTIECLDYDCIGIYLGSITITGGKITCNNSDGIGLKGFYTATITGGEISGYNYGIENSGTLILGIKGDGVVDQNQPLIISKRGYGIYNPTDEFYFYDGRIEGWDRAIDGVITEKEENTELQYSENDTILTLSTEVLPVAQVGTTTYLDLQEAINSVTAEKTVVKILKNINYTVDKNSIIVDKTKSIILDLNGYQITSSSLEKAIQNEGKLEIIDTSESKTGAITSSEERTIYNVKGAILTITGGTIKNSKDYAIYNEGEIYLQGGFVVFNYTNGTGYGIYNNSGTVTMTEGEIENAEGWTGMYNNSGTVTIAGGTIKSNYYPVRNRKNGILIVTGGNITNNNSYGNGAGITNDGNLVIGIQNDGKISKDIPIIKSTGMGIDNSGTLNYYDGIIEGKELAIDGEITTIENASKLILGKEGTYNTITLESDTSKDVSIDGVEYYSLSEAIKASKTSQKTIRLLKDTELRADVIIESNQNIIIDLNGYTLANYNEIYNAGTLRIIDTSQQKNSRITNAINSTVINNNGVLELNEGNIEGSTYGIENSKNVNITGGELANNGYGIYNKSSGNINITGGDIYSNTYGIYNDSDSAIINQNGGKIYSNTYGIYNFEGTANIDSIGITNNTYGIYNVTGTVNIKNRAEIQSNIGVYAENGDIYIGEIGNMDELRPIIIGEEYGISVKDANIYMYDGQIKGKKGATQGFITYTESGYVVANRVEGEYFVDYLARAGTINAVAEVNGISYSNLQSAINSIVGTEPQTIKLTNGIITNMTFTIAEGQNIILDMNEKTISSDLSVTVQQEQPL